MDNHQLLLAFNDDTFRFAMGFECGRTWHQLTSKPNEVINVIMHAANAEMVLRMAEATERVARSVDLDDLFIDVTFMPQGWEEKT